MTPEYAAGLLQEAVKMALFTALPLLVAGLLAGLVMSVFQAATQIQEMTLSFVPKIVAVFVCAAIFGHWMLARLVEFTQALFQSIPSLIQ